MSDATRLERQMLHELEKIEHNTEYAWWTILWQGLLRGAAFTLGSVFIIAIAGWALSALGVIPGLGSVTQKLQSTLPSQTQTR